MEAVAKITKRKFSEYSTDWKKCLICQRYDRKNPVRNLTSSGIQRILQVVSERKQNYDYDNWDTLLRLEMANIDDTAKERNIFYHKNCYGTFTSSMHVNRLKKKLKLSCCEATTNTPENTYTTNASILRSSFSAVNTKLCIFCQSQTPEKTCLVETMEVSNKIMSGGRNDDIMRCRLAGFSDLVAADARYHLKCYVQFIRKLRSSTKENETEIRQFAINKVAESVSTGMAHGDIYSLADVWDMYSVILLEKNAEVGSYRDNKSWFKDRLQFHLGDKIDFVQQLDQHQPQLLFPKGSEKQLVQTLKAKIDELSPSSSNLLTDGAQQRNSEQEEMISLYHTAFKLRSDVKESPTLSNCSSVKTTDAEKMVPRSLYLFLSVLLKGDVEDSEDETSTRRLVLSIAQDIIYAVSKCKKITPKHIGLGMAVHQATRSRNLVTLLHKAGHCISYDQVRRLDTTLVKTSLDEYVMHGHIPIPRTIVPGHFFQFSADNIDIIEETLDGRGTFHATQMVAFQRNIPSEKTSCQPEILTLCKEKSLKCSEDLHSLTKAPHSLVRPQPNYTTAGDNAGEVDKSAVKSADVKDMVWILSRINDSSGSVVPSWTGFNQVFSPNTDELTTTGYLPILNAPAHEKDTLWTVLLRCMHISHTLNPEQTTVLTLDEQLYSKAIELQWANPDICKQLYLRLGGFHIAKNFMSVIGKHYADSGLKELWIESGVFGDNSSQNIMTAKCNNRCIRAHKLTCEALWHVFWPYFVEWLHSKVNLDGMKTAAKEVVESIQDSTSRDLSSSITRLESVIEDTNVVQLLEEYDGNLSPTSSYWRNYMKMISVLLGFIRAERTGDWNLHLASFSSMMPWFAIYDHTNYTRWGAVYLMEALQLQKTHPDVFAQFMSGNFVVKSSPNSFNQISTDLALEHINKICKIAGGLIGITRSEAARDRWCLTYNERSRIAEETCEMFDVKNSLDPEFTPPKKEAGLCRLKRDRDDVAKLIVQLKQFKTFRHDTPSILSLATCDVASQEVTDALLTAFSRGESKVNDFIKDRLLSATVGFHDRLELSKSPTLQTMYQVKSVEVNGKKTKMVKADRALFQRLLIAKDAGRDVNLKELLSHELSPVPLSLADTACNLHPTNKSILGNTLATGVSCDKVDDIVKKTCTISDGQALVQAIGKPPGAKTFGDLARAFTASALHGLKTQESSRVDVVFDRYEGKSIKDGTRTRRSGSYRGSIRREVQNRHVPLPAVWKQFIMHPENKADLAQFLSNELLTTAREEFPDCEVVTAGGFHDLLGAEHSSGKDVDHLKANHEEADTRVILHAFDARKNGFERVIIWCRDTDVMVLLVHYAQELGGELWIKTGTAQTRRFVAVNKIIIDSVLRETLPAFHALTGCDTVSQFAGIGKKTCWKSFQSNASLLKGLGRLPLCDTVMSNVEAFVCKLYCRDTRMQHVNDIRYQLFKKGSTVPEKLPPTQKCLHEHIKRAHYQGLVWYSSHVARQVIPSSCDFGWHMDGAALKPNVQVEDPIPSACLELLRCNCKQCSTARCTCRASKITCTGACGCSSSMCCNPFSSANDDNLDDENL